MACKHPLKGFAIGTHPSGKPQYKICSYSTHHVEKVGHTWRSADNDFISPYAEKVVTDFVPIPCGKCIDCRLDYSRTWADRCLLELQYHKSSYFVTLTYDDKSLKKYATNEYLLDTGEFGYSPTLVKKHFQDFMKRLRDDYGYEKLRFFAAGEYGDATHRPHYHTILFGLELDDLVLYKRSSLGFNYYNSEYLQKFWPYGYVVVCDVSWETCAYVARYVLKKQKGQSAEVYETFNFSPEFTLMSRRPGIGKQFYEDKKDLIYTHDYISIPTPTGGKKIYPSRYFDKLFDVDNPEEFARLKELRKEKGLTSQTLKAEITDKSYQDMLLAEEKSMTSRRKALVRKEI